MPNPSAAIEYDFFESQFGECLVARTVDGLCRIDFSDGDRHATLERLRAAHPGSDLQRAPLADAAERIFSERGGELDIDPVGTDFQQRVWRALLRIPRGATRSYREVADDIGRPGAARAVGRAVAANPLAVLVPCHRVLPATGGTGGYRWGPARKAALLRWEG